MAEEQEGKKHYLELGIEFCLELAIGLYQLGAEEMDLPHNFGIGLSLWVAATALAVRIFWIFPWVERWPRWIKATVATIAVLLLVVFAWSPVQHAYNKKQGGSQEKDTKQNPPVQQTNQGEGNTNLNAPNNQGMIIIGRSDPRYKSQLDRIEKILKTQQDSLAPDKLLARYPLGYVIFDVSEQKTVFPYQAKGVLANWTIDWGTFSYKEIHTSQGEAVEFTPPNILYTDGHSGVDVHNNIMGCYIKIGPCGGAILAAGGVRMRTEILSTNPRGTVFLFGFSRSR